MDGLYPRSAVLRGEIVKREQLTVRGKLAPEAVGMKVMAAIFADHKRLRAAQRLARWGQNPLVGRKGWVQSLPGMLGGWTQARDLMPVPDQSFRDWWERREPHDENRLIGGAPPSTIR